MKRILTHCLIITILFFGVAITAVQRNDAVVSAINLSGHKQSIPNQHRSCFTATDILSSVGMGNEQVRLNLSVQFVSIRIFSSLSNAFRINHSLQITRQKFYTSQNSFLLKSAYKELDGYYLYHLRKLLI